MNDEIENIRSDDEQKAFEEGLKMIQPDIKEWCNILKEIDTLNKAIRERKKQLKEIEPKISNFMENHSVPHFDMKDQKLELVTSKRQASLSKKTLSEILSNHCPPEQFNMLEKLIFERPKVEKKILKMKKNKK